MVTDIIAISYVVAISMPNIFELKLIILITILQINYSNVLFNQVYKSQKNLVSNDNVNE